MATTVTEFRGVDNLVYAEVTADTLEAFTTGQVKQLAPVAEISKKTSTSSETKYYDNAPALTINAEGSDEITLTVAALDLPTLADITGKQIDETTGAFLDGEATPRYFAIGYRTKLTDGTYRYVWRYKGSFSIPEESSKTIDDGTDTNNQELTYTGISTQHKFTKTGKVGKALVIDERDGKADLTSFFAQVTTADTIKAKGSE